MVPAEREKNEWCIKNLVCVVKWKNFDHHRRQKVSSGNGKRKNDIVG